MASNDVRVRCGLQDKKMGFSTEAHHTESCDCDEGESFTVVSQLMLNTTIMLHLQYLQCYSAIFTVLMCLVKVFATPRWLASQKD